MSEPRASGRTLAAVLTVLAVGIQPAAAADYATLTAVQTGLGWLDSAVAPQTPVARLRDQADAALVRLGLALEPAPAVPPRALRPFAATEAADVALVDIRLMLTQLAVQTGANDHLALVRAQQPQDGAAQDEPAQAILIRAGFLTLPALLAAVQGTPVADYLVATPEGVTARVPLVIWDDAGLQIGAGEALALDRAGGSFLINYGRLDVIGGAVSGTEPVNPTEPAFRPFVLTAGAGEFHAQDAQFAALGFGSNRTFGGLAISNNALMNAERASDVSGSTLTGVTSLVVRAQGTRITGNRLIGSNGPAIEVSGGHGVVVDDNLVLDATGHQAIRITLGSEQVQVSGNIALGGARNGILIDRGSSHVSVIGNVLAGQSSAGVGVSRSDCVLVSGNLVGRNAGYGIIVSEARRVRLEGNALLFNQRSGLLVRDQSDQGRVTVAANVLAGNRDGVSGATPGPIELIANDLDGQMPRLLSGDLAGHTADYLRASARPAPDNSFQLPQDFPAPVQPDTASATPTASGDETCFEKGRL